MVLKDLINKAVEQEENRDGAICETLHQAQNMINDLDLSGRELAEIEFAKIYAADFSHGTAGHSRLVLIAKMAEALGL